MPAWSPALNLPRNPCGRGGPRIARRLQGLRRLQLGVGSWLEAGCWKRVTSGGGWRRMQGGIRRPQMLPEVAQRGPQNSMFDGA